MANGKIEISQEEAIRIERILRSIFKCERFGMGGIANSDFIRMQPFVAIFSALTYVHANATHDKQKAIEKFIEDKAFYFDDDMGVLAESVDVETIKFIIEELEELLK